jgi:PST family polysaccharide transporter
MVTALYPYISRMAATSSGAALAFVRKYTPLIAAPFLAGSLLLIATAPWVVRLLFGPEYEGTIPILRILSFAPFLLVLAHSYTTYFMLGFGYDKAWSKIVMQQAILNFAMLGPALFLLPPGIGLAVVVTAMELYNVAASYLFYRKHAPAHESRPVAA